MARNQYKFFIFKQVRILCNFQLFRLDDNLSLLQLQYNQYIPSELGYKLLLELIHHNISQLTYKRPLELLRYIFYIFDILLLNCLISRLRNLFHIGSLNRILLNISSGLRSFIFVNFLRY